MARGYRLAAGGAALTAAAVALLVAVVPAGPAVTAATPPEGAALAAAPDAVELAVSAPADPGGSHVSVVDGAGTPVRAGALAGAGPERLRLPVTITEPGTYTVAYHVALAGGGELEGSWRFGVGTAPSGAPVAAGHEHGVDPVGAALLAADAAVVLCVLVLLLRRPSRGRPAR
jgi:methionine-rich copper-binding protein CopC